MPDTHFKRKEKKTRQNKNVMFARNYISKMLESEIELGLELRHSNMNSGIPSGIF